MFGIADSVRDEMLEMQSATNYQVQMAAMENALMTYRSPQMAYGSLMNAASHTVSAPEPARRTPEQIEAQLRERMAELEREANAKGDSCEACRWGRKSVYVKCHNPLVKGFGPAPFVDTERERRDYAAICGEERALWAPKPTIIERIMGWLGFEFVPAEPSQNEGQQP